MTKRPASYGSFNLVVNETKRYTPEERMMLSHISENLKDYLRGIISGAKASPLFPIAAAWLFDSTKRSEHHVFGFVFTCRYFGIDPERMRKKIKEIDTPEKAKAILSLSKYGPYEKKGHDDGDNL